MNFKNRVDLFNDNKLPLQPKMPCLEISYLVNDLWAELQRIQKALDTEIENIEGKKPDRSYGSTLNPK